MSVEKTRIIFKTLGISHFEDRNLLPIEDNTFSNLNNLVKIALLNDYEYLELDHLMAHFFVNVKVQAQIIFILKTSLHGTVDFDAKSHPEIDEMVKRLSELAEKQISVGDSNVDPSVMKKFNQGDYSIGCDITVENALVASFSKSNPFNDILPASNPHTESVGIFCYIISKLFDFEDDPELKEETLGRDYFKDIFETYSKLNGNEDVGEMHSGYLKARNEDSRPLAETIDSVFKENINEGITGGIQGDIHPEKIELSSKLSKYLVDINSMVSEERCNPAMYREKEIEACFKALRKKKKGNPMIVGEAGVGKTSIVKALAYLINKDQAPKSLINHQIFELDVNALNAGTSYRGELEKKIERTVNFFKENSRAILFLDEAHLLNASEYNESCGYKLAQCLKPALAEGSIRMIGATTYAEYSRYICKDEALERRFVKIDVKEPDIEQSIKMVEKTKSSYEKHHGISFSDDVIRFAAETSVKYMTNRRMPDKVFDVLDDVGTSKDRGRKATKEDVYKSVASLSNIPLEVILTSDEECVRNLKSNLEGRVFGQPQAVEAVVDAIKMSRSGLSRDNKPLSTMLFFGTTGTGKTELAKALSDTMGLKLLRFDMSEYADRHSSSKLIGAPAGYVGYGDGGKLTDAVSKHPYSLILLDELEKAHPVVHNLLLQVMDDGMLVDSKNKKVNFRNTIVIATTNAGSRTLVKGTLGFTHNNSEPNVTDENYKHLEGDFSSEFINRFDATVKFDQLSDRVTNMVIDKFVAEINRQLKGKSVKINVSDEVKHFLAGKGYDKNMGARSMDRVIRKHIKKPLAEFITSGELTESGCDIDFVFSEGEVELKVKEVVI